VLDTARAIEEEVTAVGWTTHERDMPGAAARARCRSAAGRFSRRHIDLQRVAGALCPAHAAPGGSRRTA
jgi:hypothetical protein